MKYILCSAVIFSIFYSNSQHHKVKISEQALKLKKIKEFNPKKSEIYSQELLCEIFSHTDKPRWNKQLINFDKEHKLPAELEQIIKTKTKLKETFINSSDVVEKTDLQSDNTPVLGVNFKGNAFTGGTPPDNSIAVSNGGYMVSVANSSIYYYSIQGQLLYSNSFSDFIDEPSLTSSLYDPVVLYDSGSDRFFMVILHGFTPSKSKVLACFSKTNNPLDGWNIYDLTGNPTTNNVWFDYPKIGVSNNEVYITGNLFSAQNNYFESVIYQIDKNDGYSGSNLTWQLWSDISQSPFTLNPVSNGHQGNYGPGIFLISSYGTSDLQNQAKLRLYNLTNDLSNSPQLNLFSTELNYTTHGRALQKGTNTKLHTGDNRILNAFYLNGTIHFVFSSEYQNGYTGINYNRLKVSSVTNQNLLTGKVGYDYSHPSVASFSSNENDNSVIIGFLRSSSSIYPEFRAIHCNHNGEWSNSTLIKQGESYVDFLSSEQNVTRWGDYSGISRKHNSTKPEVWLSGCYGIQNGSNRVLETWVGQINSLKASINEMDSPKNKAVSIYPNPVFDMFEIDFYLKVDSQIEIFISDINGKVVKKMFKDKAKKGRNQFSFNKGALTSGIYFLNINVNSNNIKSEKIIIK